jgi:ABC-type multidrug transport system fused ATPase/permease subunit
MTDANSNSIQTLTVKNILIKFGKENPGTAFIYLITLFLVPIQDVGLPHLYGRVINAIQNKNPLFKPFAYLIALIALLQVGVLIGDWNENYYSYPALQAQIRKDIIETIFNKYETDYDEQQTATLIAKMVKLPTVLYNLVDLAHWCCAPPHHNLYRSDGQPIPKCMRRAFDQKGSSHERAIRRNRRCVA